MDPLTHTLVGANLAAIPAARRARIGTAAMMIAANLPDVDVLSYAAGSDFALGFRRGWTHGLPALVVLPLVLWGLLLLRARRRAGPHSKRPGTLLIFCHLGVLSHPALDWLNTYGMRWRMPLDGTWTYGDSVFIIDPWLWLLLGAPWLLSRRTGQGRRAAAGLAAAVLWIVSLLTLQGVTETRVRAALDERLPGAVAELMVGPEPLAPLRWDVVALSDSRYHVGRFSWPSGELVIDSTDLVDARSDPLWRRLEASGQAPGFLGWVRYPWLETEEAGDQLHVYVMDARYMRRRTTAFGGALFRLSRTTG